MADTSLYHKNAFTSRGTGYKFRTLSTSTPDKRPAEENLFDRKIKELKRAISTRIENECSQMAEARESILERIGKIDGKIESMLQMQESVVTMRKSLSQAEITLAELIDKVEKIELATAESEVSSLKSKVFSARPRDPILEDQEIELSSSIITNL